MHKSSNALHPRRWRLYRPGARLLMAIHFPDFVLAQVQLGVQTVNVTDGVQTGNQPTKRLGLFDLVFSAACDDRDSHATNGGTFNVGDDPPPQIDVRGNQDQSLFGSLDEADDLMMNRAVGNLHGGASVQQADIYRLPFEFGR